MSKKLVLSSVICAAFLFTTVGCGKKPATVPNETTVVVAPVAEENKPAVAADENKPADATAAPAPAPAEPAPAAPASDAGTPR